MSESLETSKVRQQVLKYFSRGSGIDIGCSRDPLTNTCIAFDKDTWPEVTQIGDMRALPMPSESLDWVWSSHALEDLEDTQAALTEWLRVLKSGGIIGLYVPHPELYAQHGSGNTDHKHPGFTPEELEKLLTSLGCQIFISKIDDDISDKFCPRYSTLVIARKR